jgi:hypothetical protein
MELAEAIKPAAEFMVTFGLIVPLIGYALMTVFAVLVVKSM